MNTVARRTRADIRLGRHLRFGQRWRRRHDGLLAIVCQIHRADCIAELIAADRRVAVRFAELRAGWDQLVSHDLEQPEPTRRRRP